jgi:hypothetical protein
MSTALSLLDLPEELLTKIFRSLDSKTLLTLSTVCNFTFQILSNNTTKIWKSLLKHEFKETNKLKSHFVSSWKEFYFAYQRIVKSFNQTFPSFLSENWMNQNTSPLNSQISVDPSFVNSCFKVLFFLEGFHSRIDLYKFVRYYYNDIWRLRMGIDTLIRYCCENELYDDALHIVDNLQLATEWKRRYSALFYLFSLCS